MTTIEWKPEYLVGNAEEDQQHEELIGQVGVLYEQLSGHLDTATVKAILSEMHAGISAHFAVEEKLMRAADYDEYAKHKADHEDLLDQIRGLMDSFTKNAETGRKVLRGKLSEWFSRHLTGFDDRWHDQVS